MRYLIIGLGIYGTNLATYLTDLGHEVIGADNRVPNVDAIKNYISTAYVLDSTDEQAIGVLPLRNVDLVIVTIGENFGASVKTVALLKKLKVPHIYARAIDSLHKAILESFSVDRVLTPEQRAAHDLAQELQFGTSVDSLDIDGSNMVMKFTAPDYFVGARYVDLDLEKSFGLKLICVSRPTDTDNMFGIPVKTPAVIDVSGSDATVMKGDIFTVFGKNKAYRHMDAVVSKS